MMEEIKGTEMKENSKEGFSRFLTYFISICVFSFSLFLLTTLLPVIAVLSDLLAYLTAVFFSVLLSLVFIFLLDRGRCKNLDFILLPVILSTIGSLGFGFLKYMESLVQLTSKALNGISLRPPGVVHHLSIPNVNLLFILFIIFFNAIFLYKYLQSSGEKKYILLYLVPIFCFILISILIGMSLSSVLIGSIA